MRRSRAPRRWPTPDGIIVGYDADCTCDTNYLSEIEAFFTKEPKAVGCSLFFEHPIEGNEFPPEVYKAIIQYELYLRYYIEGLRMAHFPYAYHTLGSSFAVRANAYALQGGMNKRKAGEDFYFLHKIIPLANYFEINSTKVIPSPRTSDRVPFGTGAAITKIIESNQSQYLTYNPDVFKELRIFFDSIPQLFRIDDLALDSWMHAIHPSLQRFLLQNNFKNILTEINVNCSKSEPFKKRFFVWFNGLLVLQYLNEAHVNDFDKIPVEQASQQLLNNCKAANAFHLLQMFREHQRKFWTDRSFC